jgi:hypothetical protein
MPDDYLPEGFLYTPLTREMKVEFPDFRVVYKTRENCPLWLWIAFKAAGLVNKAFFTRYATVIGSSVYLPKTGSKNPASIYNLLRHERVHMRDDAKWGLLYKLSYLLALPAGWTFRAHWEWRAYQQTLICWHESDTGIRAEDVDWMVDLFAGPEYLWMNPFHSLMKAKVLKTTYLIQEGVLKGPNYPHPDPPG